MIEMVLSDPRLAGCGWLGVVVQAFGKRASFVLTGSISLATSLIERSWFAWSKAPNWTARFKRAQM